MYMLPHVTINFIKRYMYYFLKNSGNMCNMLHIVEINSGKLVT